MVKSISTHYEILNGIAKREEELENLRTQFPATWGNFFYIRVLSLRNIPDVWAGGLIDLVIGASSGIFSALSGGTLFYPFSQKSLETSKSILPITWEAFLRVLNPKISIERTENEAETNLHHFIYKKFTTDANKHYLKGNEEDNWKKRHVSSRLTYVVALVAALVTGAVDVILMAPASFISLVATVIYTVFSRRLPNQINNIAFKVLKVPGIFENVLVACVGIVNPKANMSLIPSKKPEAGPSIVNNLNPATKPPVPPNNPEPKKDDSSLVDDPSGLLMDEPYRDQGPGAANNSPVPADFNPLYSEGILGPREDDDS